MTTELPDYSVGNGKFYFSLSGREIAAEVDQDILSDEVDVSNLKPEDMNFTVVEVTDGDTQEVIECTDKMRRLIAAMICDHMTKAYK
ncbi:hypothetical protein HZC21_06455 [Candidatus Peregrinibacteria bacterium]|nr:hypothetical protein [Candidatus Peregrinibacteria bacterium]